MSPIKKLYLEIWLEREHYCQVCGYPIPEPIAHVFSHLYSKGAHPGLKLVKANIELWCSTLIRQDGATGCHELHHTNPSAFHSRASGFGWKRKPIEQLIKIKGVQ